MNLLHWIIYLIRYALYMVLSTLFRLYLLLVFLAKDAAPTLITILLGVGFYVGWSWVAPLLTDWFTLPLAFLEGVSEGIEPWHLPTIALVVLFCIYLALGILGRTIRFVLTAFPFPPRPLPPLRRWTPPNHRIRTVLCTVTVPRLMLRYWDGNQNALSRRLKGDVRALLSSGPKALRQPSEPLPAPAIPVTETPQPSSSTSSDPTRGRRPPPPPVPGTL